MKTRLSAFTLVELIVAMMLLGIALLSLFTGFQEALKHMGVQRDILRAAALCEDLMNEIRSKAYYGTNEGPVNIRVDCVGIDDYLRLPQESPPETMEGDVIPGFSGFTRRVFVENISPEGFDFNVPSVTNKTYFKRITVVVSNDYLSISNISVVSRYDQQ